MDLDGGGLGVISQLLIMDEIMKRIQHQLQLDTVPHPGQYADLLIGTALGGLVSLTIAYIVN